MLSTSKLLAAALLSFGAALPAAAADPTSDTCAKPDWPAEAVRYELEGSTILYFRLNEEGRAIEPTVFRSSRWQLLDQAAIKSLSACRFPPEMANKAAGGKLPVMYAWTLDGDKRSHPVLVEGSCPASERFLRFAPFDKGVTGPDGILVRLLVGSDGTPFGAKAEARNAAPALVQAALEYVRACRFASDPTSTLQRSDTVTGRVLLK